MEQLTACVVSSGCRAWESVYPAHPPISVSGLSSFILLQNTDYPFLTKPLTFHQSSSFAKLKVENSCSQWPGFRGKGQGQEGLAAPNPLDLELHYFAVHVLKGLVSSVMSKLVLSNEQ